MRVKPFVFASLLGYVLLVPPVRANPSVPSASLSIIFSGVENGVKYTEVSSAMFAAGESPLELRSLVPVACPGTYVHLSQHQTVLAGSWSGDDGYVEMLLPDGLDPSARVKLSFLPEQRLIVERGSIHRLTRSAARERCPSVAKTSNHLFIAVEDGSGTASVSTWNLLTGERTAPDLTTASQAAVVRRPQIIAQHDSKRLWLVFDAVRGKEHTVRHVELTRAGAPFDVTAPQVSHHEIAVARRETTSYISTLFTHPFGSRISLARRDSLADGSASSTYYDYISQPADLRHLSSGFASSGHLWFSGEALGEVYLFRQKTQISRLAGFTPSVAPMTLSGSRVMCFVRSVPDSNRSNVILEIYDEQGFRLGQPKLAARLPSESLGKLLVVGAGDSSAWLIWDQQFNGRVQVFYTLITI